MVREWVGGMGSGEGQQLGQRKIQSIRSNLTSWIDLEPTEYLHKISVATAIHNIFIDKFCKVPRAGLARYWARTNHNRQKVPPHDDMAILLMFS